MTMSRAADRLARWRRQAVELIQFGTVGAVAFVTDLGLFNLLRFGPGRLLEDKPLTARVAAVAVATLVSWVGNRHWTFAGRRTERRGRELVLYAVVNAAGILVQFLTLAFTHYGLGLVSPLADNASTVGGIVIGTVVRYFGYKFLVFTADEEPAVFAATGCSAADTPADGLRTADGHPDAGPATGHPGAVVGEPTAANRLSPVDDRSRAGRFGTERLA